MLYIVKTATIWWVGPNAHLNLTLCKLYFLFSSTVHFRFFPILLAQKKLHTMINNNTKQYKKGTQGIVIVYFYTVSRFSTAQSFLLLVSGNSGIFSFISSLTFHKPYGANHKKITVCSHIGICSYLLSFFKMICH